MILRQRAAATFLDRALRAMRVVVITGPRQSGKSTFVREHPSLAGRPFISLDDPTLLQRARENPNAFILTNNRATIDEVQREPDLILAIKKAVDHQTPPIRGQFVLTGSANLLMMREVADSLSGRAYYMQLWPMTRREQLGLGATGIWDQFFSTSRHQWLDMIGDQAVPQEAWQTYAARGGFPEVALEDLGLPPEDRGLWFDGYLTTYLERDLRDLANIPELGDFQRVMRATALRVGNLINQSEISRDVKLSAMTIHRYLNLLETSYQVIRLEPYAVNRTVRLIKSPKLYWNDPGLGLHLASGGQSMAPDGAHFENLVLCDLTAWKNLYAPAPNVMYWRTTSGIEVDFVIEWKDQLFAIEVKAGKNPNRKDARGLRAFLDVYSDTAIGGIVLHGGDECYWIDEDILAVPWWRVM